MQWLDLSFPDPAWNLACDEALLEILEEGYPNEILRFWESPSPFVVLGYSNRISTEANISYCQSRQIPILRRCSGGGTVLQGPGCLNYSVILRISEEGSLSSARGTNRFVMTRLRDALQPWLPDPVEIQGYTDLTLGNRKFSGNSQRRKRKALLFHGTFLLDMDIRLIHQALHLPNIKPDYRQNRSHSEFLIHLPLPAAQVKKALRSHWVALNPMNQVPMAKIEDLVAQKYSQSQWNKKF